MADPYFAIDGAHERAEIQADNEAQAIGAILDEWIGDAAKVAEYMDDLIGSSQINSDSNTHFSADLAAILLAPESDWDTKAHAWLWRLREQLRGHMTPFAEQEHEQV